MTEIEELIRLVREELDEEDADKMVAAIECGDWLTVGGMIRRRSVLGRSFETVWTIERDWSHLIRQAFRWSGFEQRRRVEFERRRALRYT